MILRDYTNQNIGGYQHPLGESHSSNQSTSIKTTKQGFEHCSNGGISEWLSILMILPIVVGQTLVVAFNEIRHIFLLHMRTFHRKSEEKALGLAMSLVSSTDFDGENGETMRSSPSVQRLRPPMFDSEITHLGCLNHHFQMINNELFKMLRPPLLMETSHNYS